MDWDVRLTELAAEHAVPGVSLAVLDGDTVTTAATGVLNTATGVPVTPDSLFRIGSIARSTRPPRCCGCSTGAS